MVKRISIIGGGGTGKTTLSLRLSEIFNLPVYHIDGIKYLPEWHKRSDIERFEILNKYIQEEKWIIDGNFQKCEKERFTKSDLIIFLDYSFINQLFGVVKRMITNLNKEVVGIPGCKEKINPSFFKFVLKFNKTKRKWYLDLLKTQSNSKVLIFKNKKQLNKYLDTIQKKR